MSDFSRLLEIALEADPKKVETALGVPPPGLAEQMAENEKAVDEANRAMRPAPAMPEHREESRRK